MTIMALCIDSPIEMIMLLSEVPILHIDWLNRIQQSGGSTHPSLRGGRLKHTHRTDIFVS